MNRDKVGQEIKEARRAKGVSQEVLGAQCGVSGAAVKKWEKGETFPTRDKWPVLERELGLPRDWFYSQQLPTEEQRPPSSAHIGGPGNIVQNGVNNGIMNVGGGVAAAPVQGGEIVQDLCERIARHLAGKTTDERIEFRARVRELMEEKHEQTQE